MSTFQPTDAGPSPRRRPAERARIGIPPTHRHGPPGQGSDPIQNARLGDPNLVQVSGAHRAAVEGYWWGLCVRCDKAATVKDDPLYMMIKHRGPEPFESHDMCLNFIHDVSEFIGRPGYLGACYCGCLVGNPGGTSGR